VGNVGIDAAPERGPPDIEGDAQTIADGHVAAVDDVPVQGGAAVQSQVDVVARNGIERGRDWNLVSGSETCDQ
jgi:hypothetical protein